MSYHARANHGQNHPNCGNRQSLKRVPRQSGSSSSSASAVPGVRAGPTLQSYGASSTFVAQADTTVPEAWGHQQSNLVSHIMPQPVSQIGSHMSPGVLNDAQSFGAFERDDTFSHPVDDER